MVPELHAVMKPAPPVVYDVVHFWRAFRWWWPVRGARLAADPWRCEGILLFGSDGVLACRAVRFSGREDCPLEFEKAFGSTSRAPASAA